MFSCLFGKSGYFATIPLEDRWTVTADWYVHLYLLKVLEVWYQHSPKLGIFGLFLHLDNASTQTAATTVDFLNEREMQLLLYSSYSPDLSPCDFFLFPEMILFEMKNAQHEDACWAFTRAVEDIPKSAWTEEWNKWLHCMAKCIAADGRFLKKNLSNSLSGETNQ